MTIRTRPLGFPLDALEPAMSARTLEHHYGQHYSGYLATLNRLIKLTEFETMPLADIIRHANGKPDQLRQQIFNAAAQAWNHEFFWDCLLPAGGGVPPETVRRSLEGSFGSLDAFRAQFVEAGVRQFGSGWLWLVAKAGALHIVTTSNAQIPSLATCQPLLVCDLWEHAYYLDFQSNRAAFIRSFVDKLVNWRFVGRRMEENGARLAA
jgi:superoxide dismutase, Fe-Mn family